MNLNTNLVESLSIDDFNISCYDRYCDDYDVFPVSHYGSVRVLWSFQVSLIMSI